MFRRKTYNVSEKMYKGVAHFESLPWQRNPWFDKAPILLLTGGAGGGKSRLAGEKIVALHKRYPGSTGLMLRKAREFCNKSIVPFVNHSVLSGDQTVRINKSGFLFEFSNGSQLYWGGMKDQMQRESIRSIGKDGSLDWVWVEEGTAFTRDDFEEILVRMRGKSAQYTQIVISTNPDSPAHWINADLIENVGASTHYSSWRENPHNPPEYGDRLDMLRGARRARLRDGLWVAAEGRVFHVEENNYVNDLFIPQSWQRFISIDFGVKNPTVVLWAAVSPDKIIYVYRELYVNNISYSRIAKKILALSAGETITATFCDHDAGARLTFLEEGLNTSPAYKSVLAGIDIVNNYLSGDNYMLRFLRNMLIDWGGSINDEYSTGPKIPESLLEELPGYVWDKRPRDGLALDKPIKQHDHGCDALRYLCASFARQYAEIDYKAVVKYKSQDPYKTPDYSNSW